MPSASITKFALILCLALFASVRADDDLIPAIPRGNKNRANPAHGLSGLSLLLERHYDLVPRAGCVNAGYVPCPGNSQFCCPASDNCALNLGGCCPKNSQTCGGQNCCHPGAVCCNGGRSCCAGGESCCDSNHCCFSNEFCCNDGEGCCTRGATCCPGGCCPSGSTCAGNGLCRRTSSPAPPPPPPPPPNPPPPSQPQPTQPKGNPSTPNPAPAPTGPSNPNPNPNPPPKSSSSWSASPSPPNGAGFSVDLESENISWKGDWKISTSPCNSSSPGKGTSGSGSTTDPITMTYSFKGGSSIALQMSANNAQWSITLNGNSEEFSIDETLTTTYENCTYIGKGLFLDTTLTNTITITLLGAPLHSGKRATGLDWSFMVTRILVTNPTGASSTNPPLVASNTLSTPPQQTLGGSSLNGARQLDVGLTFSVVVGFAVLLGTLL